MRIKYDEELNYIKNFKFFKNKKNLKKTVDILIKKKL